jgi:hypothetical protein
MGKEINPLRLPEGNQDYSDVQTIVFTIPSQLVKTILNRRHFVFCAKLSHVPPTTRDFNLGAVGKWALIPCLTFGL